MPQQIDIPNVGLVEFPDGMADSDIASAIKTRILPQHQQAQRLAVDKAAPQLPTPGLLGQLGQAFTTPPQFVQDYQPTSGIGKVAKALDQVTMQPASIASALSFGAGLRVAQAVGKTAPLVGDFIRAAITAPFASQGLQSATEGASTMAGQKAPDAESIAKVILGGVMASPLAETAAMPRSGVNPNDVGTIYPKGRDWRSPEQPAASKPLTPPEAVAPSPFDKGKPMPTQTTKLDVPAAKAEMQGLSSEDLQKLYAQNQNVTRALMQQGRLDEASNFATRGQFMREELERRAAAPPAAKPLSINDLVRQNMDSPLVDTQRKPGTPPDAAHEFNNAAALLREASKQKRISDADLQPLLAEGKRIIENHKNQQDSLVAVKQFKQKINGLLNKPLQPKEQNATAVQYPQQQDAAGQAGQRQETTAQKPQGQVQEKIPGDGRQDSGSARVSSQQGDEGLLSQSQELARTPGQPAQYPLSRSVHEGKLVEEH